jgi:hypothetical protein
MVFQNCQADIIYHAGDTFIDARAIIRVIWVPAPLIEDTS